jgi:hypothetical protein
MYGLTGDFPPVDYSTAQWQPTGRLLFRIDFINFLQQSVVSSWRFVFVFVFGTML